MARCALDCNHGGEPEWQAPYACNVGVLPAGGPHRAPLRVCAGCCPNVSANDLLGEGWSGRRWRVSVDRGHFYVWANKKGTVRDTHGNLCVDGNYEPAWTMASETYEVRAEWPEKLWKAYKLDDQVYYDEYLFLCKDKIPAKKRNFEAHRTWHSAKVLEAECS